jgi:hypothetical protein
MRAVFLGVVLIVGLGVASFAQAQSEPSRVATPGSPEAETAEVSVSYVEREAAPEKQKKWNFALAPYLIFPFMNGSVSLANQSISVNANTRDLLKRLNWALMLYFEAAHPKFSIITDILYMNLADGGTLPSGRRDAELRMQQLATEFVFLGRLASWFELGFGGRVNFVQAGITAPAGMLLPAIDLDFRQTWFDPLVALRFSVPFKNDHWRLGLRADVGGFTLGSTYAWQVYPYGGYNFDGIKDRRVFELVAAFRAFGMKYETGSGPSRFVYDMIIWGPEVGFVFHF